MAYMDEHSGGHDSNKTTDGLHMYGGGGEPEVRLSEKETTETTAEQITEGKQARKPKEGILQKAKNLLFGKRPKKQRGTKLPGDTTGGVEEGLGKIAAKLSNPKILTALVMGTGIGVFSILGIFTSYKNDDMIRNDNPLRCEQGVVELPAAQGEGGDNDVQETVNIMYDIFVNQFGYSEYDLVGMVACMLVETGCNPDRLESDYILTSEKETFDGIAGVGIHPKSDIAKAAYWDYGTAFQSRGGWNGNNFYIVDGHMCCGIGLIQWTAGRANSFIEGLDKVSLDVSPMDVHYQCAYLIAEAQQFYEPWAPGGSRTGNGDSTTATTNFFGTMVYGHMPSAGDSHLAERLARIPEAESYVFAASANSEFTMDAVTMAEELAEEGFNSSVASAQAIQFCVNNTFIVNADIAHAAVSISFLERGDYEDVNGAYGSYRRAARSPNMINDWDFEEGHNGDVGSLSVPASPKTYGSERGVMTEPKKSWPFYDNSMGKTRGTLDLIACTEYYYFAHMIAFPKETGNEGQNGYFSSCDRGTATAVRIAGADDKFPAGNPLYQLNWATGAAKQGSKHNENARGTQGKGFLWKFAGFMRGSDLYSAGGSASINAGTVMISWSERAANDLLGENAGGATSTESGTGMLATDDPSLSDDEGAGGYAGKNEAVKLAGLRWPKAIANSTRHIITYVGDATVQDFWGLDWLYQQWQLFDDADRLIRKDLTETVPEVMSKGLAFKASYASKSTDQHMTFYKAKAMGAEDNDDVNVFEPANYRPMEFNSKTGLPEFHAWEQIYIRLIHNSDDDAAAQKAEKKNLYEDAYPYKEDGYLDLVETEEVDAEIEQYDGEQTVGNKFFFEDWNSLGISVDKSNTTNDKSDHTNDYKDPASYSSEKDLVWYDNTGTDDDEIWTHARNAAISRYWRYELVTDIEYRQNQFLRFGLASLMCSIPSEEDADVYQTGGDGNDTGHIMGNLYRRYSRIPDKTDSSGRYYYYNTVVSNDMLQDLVQLYVEERNAYTEGEGESAKYVTNSATGPRGKNERSYGPMYLIGLGRVYATGRYKSTSASDTNGGAGWVDRRYGLTADDIEYIISGIEGNKMGEAETKDIKTAFTHILTEPMHVMSEAQLSLYNNKTDSKTALNKGAHEGEHLFNEYDLDGNSANPYETEIYGMNPFLMLESKGLLNIAGDATSGNADSGDVSGTSTGMSQGSASSTASYGEMGGGKEDWLAGHKNGLSVRNDVEGELTNIAENGSGTAAKGIDPTSTNGTMDDRLAWIDRHYFVTKNGGIGTFAYQVMALQPSAGSKVSASGYETKLKNVTTLTAGHTGQSNAANLMGSKGLVQYSDYIYADNAADNKQMAKRLFGKDDRNKDGATTVNGARDDYNRRDFILIPYYHTHSQQCSHNDLEGFSHYKLNCKWTETTGGDGTPLHIVKSDALSGAVGTQAKIDTQIALNGNGAWKDEYLWLDRVSTCTHEYDDAHDYGDTISFNETNVINRGKYNMNQILASSQGVRYFADTGDEILWNAKPYIHVTCNGWYQTCKCDGSATCLICGDPCPADESCPGISRVDETDEEGHVTGSHLEGSCTIAVSGVHPKDCSGAIHDCAKCAVVCHACGQTIKCHDTVTHNHSCQDCLNGGWCHDHKECDDYGQSAHTREPCPCDGSYGGHHLDGGETGKDYQSDKCHYEYGCNALEFLYHNLNESTSADGSRQHYRLRDHDKHIPQGQYDPATMELYTVNAIYMVIPTSPDVSIGDFDIRDYIKSTNFNVATGEYAGGANLNTQDWQPDGYPWGNNAVVPDKCNLVQQVMYDSNGWVTNNWQDLIKAGTEGSFLNPKTDSAYENACVMPIKLSEKHADHGGSSSRPAIGHPALDEGVKYTTGTNSAYNWSNDGILQYFTIEGDVIHRESDWAGYIEKVKAVAPNGKEQSEFTANINMNGTKDDLKSLESIRNRVGFGKQVSSQTISVNDEKYTVSQSAPPGPRGSSQQMVYYENSWRNESGDASSVVTGNGTGLGNHGWGEMAVVGTQHPKDLRSGGTDYGNSWPLIGGNASVSGPDGSLGNNIVNVNNTGSLNSRTVNTYKNGSSLLREIIGDEHVVHVKFDNQSYKGLTKQDAGDNGRDFMFYVDKKQAAKDLKGDPSEEIKPKEYQSQDSDYYKQHLAAGDFEPTGGADATANKYGVFKSVDMDTLYMNYYTQELTDKMYAEEAYPHNSTDDEKTETGTPNKKNPPALAMQSAADGATNSGKAYDKITTFKEQEGKAGTPVKNVGDYSNWVTHASRGTRGMMTQYLDFAGFFKDVYNDKVLASGDKGSKTNAYMLFEVVMRTDIMTTEQGGTDEYGYPMGSNDADHDKDRYDPDAKDNGGRITKQEGFVYETKPGDAVLDIPDIHRAWGYGDGYAFSDTYGQGSNSHWKNMIDLYNAAMSTTRED